MKFEKLNRSNIDILYDLNLQLAIDENQAALFTADKEQYAEAFLGRVPFTFGCLGRIENQAVGFFIYTYKFASYSGGKVLYIEDIFLKEKFRTEENKVALLQHAVERSIIENCCRVEMRVLKTFNYGYEILADFGFNQITKWDVYRLEHIR